MPKTLEYLHEYWWKVVDLENKGFLPFNKLDVCLPYYVFSIGGSKFGAHKSIVLTTDNERFVTVELGFRTVDGRKFTSPVTRPLLELLAENKLEYLGTIMATGVDLIEKAVVVMKQFGSYSKFCHNCQDFCNMYLKAIGLRQAQTLTDGDKVSVGILVPLVVTSSLLSLLFLLRRIRN